MTIDHLGAEPVYRQLAAILRDQIRTGRLPVGRPVPSLPQLTGTYGVSRGTAGKAVRVLVTEGLVRVVPGRGAYVINKRPPK